MTAPAAPAAPVPAPSAALRRGHAALALLAVLAVAALVLTHAPARQASATRTQAPDLNSLIHGAPLQRASCTNWLGAKASERALAVRALTASVGAPTEYEGYHGTTLTSAQTYSLLDNACAQPVARNFLIYVLYARAAGFGGAGL